MLKLAGAMGELRFSQLMDVYQEWNLLKTGGSRGEALLSAEQEFYDYLSGVFFRTRGAVYALWEVSGRYVSALRLEPYQDGLLLNALETAPEYRRRGYAHQLILAVLEQFPESKIYSHIAKTNSASIMVHEKSGFRRISDHARYLDGSVDQRSYTYAYEKTAIGN